MNLTPKEVAERLRVSTGTLSNWRTKGEGPRFLKYGRKVVYPLAELEAWEKARMMAATNVRVA